MTMTEPSIRDRAYQFFQQEALDLLQTLEDGLLNLRVQYDIPHIHELMRAAHSIKGGASSVQLHGISKIAHKMEDVFRALYRRTEPLDADLDEALLQAYDCLRLPLMEQLQTGQYDEVAAWEKAEPIFDLIEAVFQLDMDADVELPTAAELGVDIVYEVFSGDVRRGIDRITEILKQPGVEPLAGEIRATSEVFVGIGDLLGLAGFSAIAQATIQALNANPDKALAIGCLAVECFQAAQAGVMDGDRTQGGSPSPALLALGQPSPDRDLEASTADRTALETATGDRDPLEDTFGNVQSTDLENLEDTFGDFQSTDLENLEDTFGSFPSTDLESLYGGFSDRDLAFQADLDVCETACIELPVELPDAEPEVESSNESTASEFSADPGALEAIFGQFAFETEEESGQPLESSADSNSELEDIFGSGAIDLSSADWNFLPASEDVNASESSALNPASQLETAIERPSQEVAIDLESNRQVVDITPAVKSNQKAATSSNAYIADSVRVDVLRLEQIDNLVGELITQENGALLQSQQLQATLKRLQQKFTRFEELSKNLQTWMDESLYSEVRGQLSPLHPAPALGGQNPDLASLQDFDALQMDSYSGLYTLLQESLEEIAQMDESIGDIALISRQSQQIQRKKQQTLKQVRNDLMWARMIPLGDILNRFPRMVRDLATRYRKQVTFKQYGTSTLVDKAILERLYDPLVHLIRNAFDHGTESAESRIAQGKPAEATIEVRAYHRGNQTIIEVRDDGRGIDAAKIRATAIARGLLAPAEAETAPPERLYDFLFEPSFSTAAEVSELSGRGMGMSAVQQQVQALKGSIAIASELGKGTSFTISLPLTLTIAKLLVFSVEAQYMAIPVDTLVSIVAAADKDMQLVDGQPFYCQGDRQIPLYSTSTFSQNYPLPGGFAEKPRFMSLPQGGKVPLLLIASGKGVIALLIDRIVDEQELVIKPFGSVAAPPPYLYGCAILGNGSLVPVIDSAALMPNWQTSTEVASPVPPQVPAPPIDRDQQTILVVDDSLTTRQNLTLTLQKFGYQVVQAGDGKEALEKLRQEPNIKAVFSDVEMPTMNGFEFLSACRKVHSAATLPIIMLTSRSSDKHRGIAKLLGANHYLTKPYLEQDLLKSLQNCLEAASAEPLASGSH
ncbi:response regulator [Altericista sp. CCNU0014]|uniref:hybrid sensor histidine kinase/response regulator n=1 Tax=Altericista sp. CCNU0014 TaxID=3082949 RepID=UPI00384C940E